MKRQRFEHISECVRTLIQRNLPPGSSFIRNKPTAFGAGARTKDRLFIVSLLWYVYHATQLPREKIGVNVIPWNIDVSIRSVGKERRLEIPSFVSLCPLDKIRLRCS